MALKKRVAYLAFALLGVIWGSNFIFMKWVAKPVSPSQIVLLQFGSREVEAYIQSVAHLNKTKI